MATVVIVPGNFASQLANHGQTIWVDLIALLQNKFTELAYPDGPGVSITATAFLPGYYPFMELALELNGYSVIPFPYDWRRDIDEITSLLHDTIAAINDSSVYIITHSLGAHIARRYLQLNQKDLAKISGLIMLGPANHGTLAAAIGLAGATNLFPMMECIPDPPPSIQQVLKTFVSLYQLFPWEPARLPSLSH